MATGNEVGSEILLLKKKKKINSQSNNLVPVQTYMELYHLLSLINNSSYECEISNEDR